ncbi:AsmA family protein [Azorhizobium doebereinerae]|uniref:AsmA family protein n=1 Tax=Azorhizobium doebereinerae TaxID=281091 RepID=UPI0004299E89|nr:AsmA family protein [Azorhizobium doebereinerae]
MVILRPTARRLALAAAASAGALAGLCLIALAVAPALVPQGEVRRAATDALALSSGREVRIVGDSRFSLLPYPRILLDRVELAMPGSAALDAERITARLRLLPLLVGRADVASVTLERPILTVSGPVAVPHLSLAPFISAPGTPALRIQNGTIAWRDGTGLTQELVSGIDARLDHASGGKGISASADFTWRETAASGRLVIADAQAFLNGMDSDTRLDLSSGGSFVKFRGSAASGPSPVAEGDLSLETPDLRGLMDWVRQPTPTTGGFGRFSFGAHLSAHAKEIALTPAYVEMDGNRSEGGLTVKLDGARPLVEGTFAADALNITPYGRLSLTASGGHDWDHKRLDVSPLRKADLDLRLSATSIRADESVFERVASTVVLRGGRLDMSIGEAAAWGGLLRASLTLMPAEHAADGFLMRMEMEGTDVALDRALSDIADVRRLDGTGTIQASLAGQGSSIYGLAQSLSGDVAVTGTGGAIVGLDVAQALRHIEQRPLSGGGDLRGGRTAFTTLKAKARIDNGIAVIDGANVEGKQVKLTLGGSVSVVHRDLDLKGEASLVPANAAAQAAPFALPFIVQGAWDNAYVMPDAQSLIRRSGAAQPLLEAVRSRGGDAAVRSVIEQIAKPSPLLPANPIVPTGSKAN